VGENAGLPEGNSSSRQQVRRVICTPWPNLTFDVTDVETVGSMTFL